MSLIGYLPPKSNPRSITCYAITSAYNYSNGYCVWSDCTLPLHSSGVIFVEGKTNRNRQGISSIPTCNAIESWVKLKLPERHYILQTDSPMQL